MSKRNGLRDEVVVSAGLAVERATVLVGPALILTTVVLACGLGVTVFSDLPSLRLFGWLSAFAMVAALIADLFILRPTAMWLIATAQKLRGGRHRAGADADKNAFLPGEFAAPLEGVGAGDMDQLVDHLHIDACSTV